MTELQMYSCVHLSGCIMKSTFVKLQTVIDSEPEGGEDFTQTYDIFPALSKANISSGDNISTQEEEEGTAIPFSLVNSSNESVNSDRLWVQFFSLKELIKGKLFTDNSC